MIIYGVYMSRQCQWGLPGLSVRRGWGCPMPALWAPLGERSSARAKCCPAVRKGVQEAALRAAREGVAADAQQSLPCSPWRAQAGADIHTAAHRRPHTRAGGYLPRKQQPVENPNWSRFFLKVCKSWEIPWQSKGKVQGEAVVEKKQFLLRWNVIWVLSKNLVTLLSLNSVVFLQEIITF